MSGHEAFQYVWIDCEMTGLDSKNDLIIEIAVCLSDSSLKNVLQGPNIVINQPKKIMESMGDWCSKHHEDSGLTESVLNSTIGMKEAEQNILAFIKENITEKGVGILAGNSIHQDRIFLLKDMPLILDHLHYRIIDVSTIKELCRAWNPKVFQEAPSKKMSHRALDDILESIQELAFYKSSFFKLVE